MTVELRLSIIVPAYQEALALPLTIQEIETAARATQLPFEIIVADDGSTDGTWEVLKKISAHNPNLTAIRLSRNFGKEGAISAGLDAATGDACILLDADLQHPPDLIPQMVRLWRDDGWEIVDAVKKSRRGDGLAQRMSARLFYRSAKWLTGFDLQDVSDFKLLDRRVVEQWRRLGERRTFFRGVVAWLGFRRTAIAFDVGERIAGRSRWTSVDLFRLAVGAIASFSALPLQIVTLLGAAMMVMSLPVGAQTVRLWVTGRAFPGFTTVILLQLFIGGTLMVSLGLIGVYIARIYDEVKGRPRYIVRERF